MLKNADEKIMFFDATGSLVPKYEDKKVFLYSLVTQIKEGEPCLTVLEFLSSSHTSSTISSAIFGWKASIGNISVNVIVTDFSFALLNACSFAMNGWTLKAQIELK